MWSLLPACFACWPKDVRVIVMQMCSNERTEAKLYSTVLGNVYFMYFLLLTDVKLNKDNYNTQLLTLSNCNKSFPWCDILTEMFLFNAKRKRASHTWLERWDLGFAVQTLKPDSIVLISLIPSVIMVGVYLLEGKDELYVPHVEKQERQMANLSLVPTSPFCRAPNQCCSISRFKDSVRLEDYSTHWFTPKD